MANFGGMPLLHAVGDMHCVLRVDLFFLTQHPFAREKQTFFLSFFLEWRQQTSRVSDLYVSTSTDYPQVKNLRTVDRNVSNMADDPGGHFFLAPVTDRQRCYGPCVALDTIFNRKFQEQIISRDFTVLSEK